MRRGKLKYVAAGAFTVYNDIEENIVLRRILEDMMAQDTQKLRELLSQYIGDVYAEALQYTNDPAAAKEVTRRVMTLLKRSQEAGLAVNPSMAKRLTEDCCREREYYENRRATFVNGTIADMPDFDTALSEISPAEVRARARSEADLEQAKARKARAQLTALDAELAALDAEAAALGDPETRNVALTAQAEQLTRRETALTALAQSLTEDQHRTHAARQAQDAYRTAAAAQEAAHAERDACERAFLDAQAGLLAQGLAEGTPCPVCGSVHHPAKAALPHTAPTQAQVTAAKQAAEAADREAQDRAAAAREALAAQREGAARRAEDLRRLAGDLTGDRSQKEETLTRCRREIETARAEILRCREIQAEKKTQGDALRRRLAAISQEKLELEAQRTAKGRAGQEMNERLLKLERSVSSLETKRTTSAMEEKQILDRLWETYELSHSDAQAQRVELESLPKANRRIGELKREIASLGAINTGAIEEFDRVNGRYTYLSEQRTDVERAKGELEGVIGRITEQMTEIFRQQFDLLNESFQQTFQDLFGGGEARLELEDEKDILGCGIEIKAQPPGKTLKTISLLSGGEKAFVAIALYFAILKVRPTPFVVMDEIEAALDDNNVARFAQYMRTVADKTQFIVITHRRGTMEEADALYGVTMQEQGVSRMLSLNLNTLERELDLR